MILYLTICYALAWYVRDWVPQGRLRLLWLAMAPVTMPVVALVMAIEVADGLLDTWRGGSGV